MAHNHSSSFHNTLSSLCKSFLQPFSLNHRRLPADRNSKRHSDNLKWQQNSFHRILHLIGLHKEGIATAAQVSSFRSHLLDTLIASPAYQESPDMLRDKLLFLMELLSAKCISTEEYHSSKRPLLQRLAAQGGEINTRDVIIGGPVTPVREEEWSEIDLKEKEESVEKEKRGIKSLIGKSWKGKGKENHNPGKGNEISVDGKRKPFRSLFHNVQEDDQSDKKEASPVKKQWGLDGFKKQRKGSSGDEEKFENIWASNTNVVPPPIGEGPDTKRLKNKIHSDGSDSDFFIDRVLGDNIKKELKRIKSELSTTNPHLSFSDDQMEVISTRLPVDKSDLKHFFPKSWCDRYGDVVLDVVKKEFKDHVGEMESLRNAAREKQDDLGTWGSFEREDERLHSARARLHQYKKQLY